MTLNGGFAKQRNYVPWVNHSNKNSKTTRNVGMNSFKNKTLEKGFLNTVLIVIAEIQGVHEITLAFKETSQPKRYELTK